jgi:hypothetical protein
LKGNPPFPGEPCETEPQQNWTEQEKWVWKKVGSGEIANFNEGDHYGGPLDPKKPEGWPENRVLRPKFLETILLHEPYRGALTRHGVSIIGAWFNEPNDLENATLAHELYLVSSRFDSDVCLRYLKSPCIISFESSKFKGKLNMNGLRVESSLFMRNDAEFAEVILRGARIGDQLDMSNSKFNGKLDMDALRVESSLFMRNDAEFADVKLISARIGDQLDMSNSKFNGKLDMDGLRIESGLFMRNGAEFSEVILRCAKIGNQLNFIGSKFKDKLNMNSLYVDGGLLMNNCPELPR